MSPGMQVMTEDYHTGGEPFRIVTGGIPDLQGNTVAERRQWAQRHLDEVRQLVVNEPRGHADMYGGFLTPPDDAGADLGVVFFHNDGFSTACGHGTIAVATWAVETGRVGPPVDDMVDLVVDVPSGRLPLQVTLAGGAVCGVTFRNVPAFVAADLQIETDTGSSAPISVAFGGAFYAIGDAREFDVQVEPSDLPRIISLCRRLKDRLNAQRKWVHPDDNRLRDIYGVILVEPADPIAVPPALELGDPALDPLVQRNVTVFADGQIDRSPTGSGTSARLALLHRNGHIAADQGLINQSIVGSMMGGVVDGHTTVGDHPAVQTRVSGQAFRTGRHEFTLDPRDPIGTGFQLR